MARGTGTRRALSEANISELIRGNPEALAAQAAKGGNVQPTPNPAANPAAAPTQPTPAGQAPTPAASPTANPAAQPTPTAANPAAQPTAPANQPGNPPAPSTEGDKDKEKKKTPFTVRDGGSGPGFLFGMSGKGDINEGADTAAQAEQSQALLKKLVKKIQTGQPLGQNQVGPTPPPAGPTR